jgi:hypothetical protein
MIFKIFSPKNFAKKFTFLTRYKAKVWKKLIITLVFKKNANFFAENWDKLLKIVIITLTPGLANILGEKHLVKIWLISTLYTVIYFKGTIFLRSTKPLFTTQNGLETSWKKIAHFFQLVSASTKISMYGRTFEDERRIRKVSGRKRGSVASIPGGRCSTRRRRSCRRWSCCSRPENVTLENVTLEMWIWQ